MQFFVHSRNPVSPATISKEPYYKICCTFMFLYFIFSHKRLWV